MECIRGKQTWTLEAPQFRSRLEGHPEILLDLGTGDGRFVVAQVRRYVGVFGIGLDACRENLRETSRVNCERTLFLIANALDLPQELNGAISYLTVNFPWGSLLDGLLAGEVGLLDGMTRVCSKGARLEVRLNQSAVQEAGFPLEEASHKVRHELSRAGFHLRAVEALDGSHLRACPTTWARKMAFGREPHAILMRGEFRC